MKLFVTLLMIASAIAADKPLTEAESLAAKLKATEQELRLVKLENLIRREEVAVQQVEAIRKDQQALFSETCKAAGLKPDPAECSIDLNAKTVTKKVAPNTPKK